MLEAGKLVADRYLLQSPIGEGAMAAVWRAEDQTLRRQVAIKFLFVHGARDPQAMVDQFLREARIAASVQHRNVIHTVDFGTLDGFQPFMVMELLSGESLGDRFAREPALSFEQVCHLASLTLRGLAAVHDAGIVHRDLKPDNIFLQRDADTVYPKILDFGISRSLQRGQERPSAIATQTGLIVGTPDYMSPEQARGEPNVDRRADIYSIGVILYEGLTGRLPFDAERVGDLIVQIVTQEPPTAIEVRPDLPPALSALIQQAMAKDREQRFGDARVMRRALFAALEQGAPPTRRSALSRPPPAPAGGVPAYGRASVSEIPAPRPGPARDAGGATWGDFEGLEVTRITDLAVEGGQAQPARPSAPERRRVAARKGEMSADEATGAPPRAGRRATQGMHAATAAGELDTMGARVDPFDALGAGQGAPAVDIDYGRVRASQPRPRTHAAASRASLGRAPRGPALRPARTRGRYGYLVLPAVALALLALSMFGSEQLGSRDGESSSDADREVRSAAPAEDSAPTEPGFEEAVATPAGARGGRRALERRARPGRAAAHMRDVVFQ